MTKRTRTYEGDKELRSVETRPITISNCPVPVSDKLDLLVGIANGVPVPMNTNRSELVAALVAFTELDGESLAETVRRYRIAKVADLEIEYKQ